MGRRTSQGAAPTEPRPRKKQRSLLGMTVRFIAWTALVVLILFLIGGWVFSNEIRSGALEPPTAGPPDFAWEVVDSGSSLTLEATSDTDQAGEYGLSGIWWANGYAQSADLVSSTEDGGGWLDVRSLQPGETGPSTGTEVKVDMYYWQTDPLDAHGIEFEEVRYETSVGTLPAWYIEGTSDTWAIVVHGKGGTLQESLRVIPTLHDLGYPILVINYRNDVGQPKDSTGYHTYGVNDWKDVASAVNYANENGADEHVLFGYSYGGSLIASYLTQSPLRNFTKAAILDSPVLSLEQTVDFRASRTNLPLIPVKVPDLLTSFAKTVASWRFDIDWDQTDYITQTNNLHAPMLIFHGTNDVSVPYSSSAEMASLRPDITTLVTTEAGHTRSWNLDPEAYDTAIKEFLAEL